jgi:hypothetical protein
MQARIRLASATGNAFSLRVKLHQFAAQRKISRYLDGLLEFHRFAASQ